MASLIAALVLSAFLFQFGEATHVTAGLLKLCGMHCLEVTVWSEVSYWFANGERTLDAVLLGQTSLSGTRRETFSSAAADRLATGQKV